MLNLVRFFQVSAIGHRLGWFPLLQIFVVFASTVYNIDSAVLHDSKANVQVRSEKRNANAMCNSVTTNCNFLGINKLSICPWTMQTNVNRLRRPKRIKEAVCDCARPRLSAPNSLVCRPVYKTFAVKLLDRGTRTYRRAFERIAVACTAVPYC